MIRNGPALSPITDHESRFTFRTAERPEAVGGEVPDGADGGSGQLAQDVRPVLYDRLSTGPRLKDLRGSLSRTRREE